MLLSSPRNLSCCDCVLLFDRSRHCPLALCRCSNPLSTRGPSSRCRQAVTCVCHSLAVHLLAAPNVLRGGHAEVCGPSLPSAPVPAFSACWLCFLSECLSRGFQLGSCSPPRTPPASLLLPQAHRLSSWELLSLSAPCWFRFSG